MPDSKRDYGGELFRLVYASRAVLPVMPRFEATVGEIVAAAQANNPRQGVTGLLLAHRGWFVQALEGPRRNVSQVFGVIGRDLRHAQLELLAGGSASSRLFGQWSMCARSLTPISAPALQTLEVADDFDPFRMDGEKALAMLVAISKIPEAVALKKSA